MFERYTDSTKNLINLANQISKTRKSLYIGTEHILEAMFNTQGTIAEHILHQAGLTQRDIDRALFDIKYEEGERSNSVPLSPNAKRILELALRESIALQEQYTSPHHILLAMLRYASLPESTSANGVNREPVGVEILKEHFQIDAVIQLTLETIENGFTPVEREAEVVTLPVIEIPGTPEAAVSEIKKTLPNIATRLLEIANNTTPFASNEERNEKIRIIIAELNSILELDTALNLNPPLASQVEGP